jgi:hypothetical protein
MHAQTKYHSEVKTVPFGDGMIRVENLTPILSPKDREKRKREIETRLFDVFSKYRDNNRKLCENQ